MIKKQKNIYLKQSDNHKYLKVQEKCAWCRGILQTHEKT